MHCQYLVVLCLPCNIKIGSKCCTKNEMDELSRRHHDYGNTNRERDNFNLWGLNEQTWWSQRNETDEAGLSWSRTSLETDETHSECDVWEPREERYEATGAWWLRWLRRKPKKVQLLPGKDWRKHLPSLRCDYLEMRYLLRALNVHIILWSVLNGAPVSFVELNEDGSPKTSVTTSADSISEISLRIF